MNSRRTLLKSLACGFVLKLVPTGALAASRAHFVDVRLWPAEDYTRVTLEHDGPLNYRHFLLKDPWRLVVDLVDLEMDSTLKELTSRIEPDDPYVQRIRVGQFDEDTVRIVFDLKTEVAPEIFTIDPIAQYKQRFVLDFYPKTAVDPLLALLDEGSHGPTFEEDEITRALRLAGVESGRVTSEPVEAATKPQKKPKSERNTEVAKSAPTPKVRRLITVAIDPGHGGEDPGAVGRRGTYEKDVVLSISKLLKAEIDKIPGMRAMLTRNGDFFVPLGRRVAKARAVNSDLFVSVHADAFIRPSARGSSVFALSERGASSTAAKWLAKKENSSDLIGGVNIAGADSQLARVLLDLSTTAQISDSLKLGAAVLSNIQNINRLHKPRVEQAGFAVLKAPDIPSILVETAFISNPNEEKKLRSKRYQRQMASAITTGIKQYFAKNPPMARSSVA